MYCCMLVYYVWLYGVYNLTWALLTHFVPMLLFTSMLVSIIEIKENIETKWVKKSSSSAHYMPSVSFYIPWKQKTSDGYLMFSGGIERDEWHMSLWFDIRSKCFSINAFKLVPKISGIELNQNSILILYLYFFRKYFLTQHRSSKSINRSLPQECLCCGLKESLTLLWRRSLLHRN